MRTCKRATDPNSRAAVWIDWCKRNACCKLHGCEPRTRSGLMRVLILEQRYDGGHYLNWVKLVVMSLVDLASEIVLGIPAAAKHSSQYKLALAPIQDRFRLYDLPPDRPANRFNMIRRLAKITSQ